jgi:hypothetical protein
VNWNAVQAVAEVLGALGVIISLVYLAVQVRQNTKSVRAAASQELLASFNAVTDFPKVSQHGARVYEGFWSGFSGLTAAEMGAARIFLIQMCRVWEHAFYQHQEGLLDDRIWAGWLQQMSLSLGIPGFVQGWPAIRSMFHEDFAAFLDGHFKDAPTDLRDYASEWGSAGPSIPPEGMGSSGDAL